MLLAALILAASGCPGPAPSAPDSPRPERPATAMDPSVVTAPALPQPGPVEIRTARPLAVRGDSLLERLAGARFLAEAPRPLAVEVITAEPLGNVARSAAVEIWFGTVRAGETWPLPPDRLVVLLPDARRLRAPVSVTVAWLGDEERTRSRRPVVITEDQLRPFR